MYIKILFLCDAAATIQVITSLMNVTTEVCVKSVLVSG